MYCRVALLPSGKVAAELFSMEMGFANAQFCLAGHYLYFFVTLGVAPRNRASDLLLCSLAIYSD